jgi:hypothetical protein
VNSFHRGSKQWGAIRGLWGRWSSPNQLASPPSRFLVAPRTLRFAVCFGFVLIIIAFKIYFLRFLRRVMKTFRSFDYELLGSVLMLSLRQFAIWPTVSCRIGEAAKYGTKDDLYLHIADTFNHPTNCCNLAAPEYFCWDHSTFFGVITNNH